MSMRTFEQHIYRLLNDSYHPYASMHVGEHLAIAPASRKTGISCTYVNPIGVAYRIAETSLNDNNCLLSRGLCHVDQTYVDYRTRQVENDICVITGFFTKTQDNIKQYRFDDVLHQVFAQGEPFWDEIDNIRDKYERHNDCVGCFTEILSLIRSKLPPINTQSLDDVYWDQM